MCHARVAPTPARCRAFSVTIEGGVKTEMGGGDLKKRYV